MTGTTINDNKDAMINVRYWAKANWNLSLVIVYFILIGQLIALLILYYKRVFMIAFLIAIFPIVVAIYPLNRTGNIKINPFGVWFKEFMINVFVQSFHAVTYRVVVSVGIGSYTSSNNFLFMIICIFFLFQGEKIIRAIFNANSKAGTLGDMIMAGAFAKKMVGGAKSLIPSGGGGAKDKDKESDDAKAKDKAKKDLAKSNQAPGTEANKNAVSNIGGGSSSGGLSGGMGSSSVSDVAMAGAIKGMNKSSNLAIGQSNVDRKINAVKSERNIGKYSKPIASVVGKGLGMAGKMTGGIVGGTYGLAQTNSKDGLGNFATGLASGSAIGGKVGDAGANLVNSAVDRIDTKRAGMIVASQYESGEHDEEIGISEADRELNKEKANAIRKAFADYAKGKHWYRSKDGKRMKLYQTQVNIISESVDRKND